MTPKEALAVLVAAFSRDRIEAPTIRLYESRLRDIPGPLLGATVRRVVDSSRFFPAVAELRQTAARLAGLLPATAAEALAIVRRADVAEERTDHAGKCGYTERFWDWDGVDPVTLIAIRATLFKVGDPYGRDGKPTFGWETGFQRTYEVAAGEMEQAALRDLSRARLPEPRKALVP